MAYQGNTVNHSDSLRKLTDETNKMMTPLKTVEEGLGDKSLLTTTEKGSIVGAINEVDSAVNELDTDVGDKTLLTTTAKGSVVSAINELDADVGDKSTLTTTAKGNLVGAVNELDADLGNKSALATTEKGSLVGAINELDSDLGTHVSNSVSHVPYGVAAGTNDKAVAIASITSLVAGTALSFQNSTVNNSGVTLNVNGEGAKPVIRNGDLALPSGFLKANGVYTVRYDGMSFILQGEGGEYGTAVASDVLSGKTIGTEAGLVDGIIANRGAGGIVTPGIADIVKPAGYYSSTITVTGDADLVSENIRIGKNLFGVAGTMVQGEYATGSLASSIASRTGNFSTQYIPDSSTTQTTTNFNEITVPLTFSPKLVILFVNSNRTVYIFDRDLSLLPGSDRVTWHMPGSNYIYYYTIAQNAAGLGWYLNNTGFKLGVKADGSGEVVKWIAVG